MRETTLGDPCGGWVEVPARVALGGDDEGGVALGADDGRGASFGVREGEEVARGADDASFVMPEFS